MAACEICGKETSQRWIIRIDNSKVKSCRDCKTHGKVIKKEETKKPRKRRKTKETKEKYRPKQGKELVPGYTEKIKKAREKKEKTQKELAEELKETESRIRKIEKGRITPTNKVIRKLEKKLNITLLQQPEEIETKNLSSKEEKATIGDVIELKRE